MDEIRKIAEWLGACEKLRCPCAGDCKVKDHSTCWFFRMTNEWHVPEDDWSFRPLNECYCYDSGCCHYKVTIERHPYGGTYATEEFPYCQLFEDDPQDGKGACPYWRPEGC